MRCPNCDQAVDDFSYPCPACGLSGDPVQLEELARLKWLLAEISGWQFSVEADRQQLEARYLDRRGELEIALGLRLPPVAPAEAEPLWRELIHREILSQRLPAWSESGLLAEAPAQELRSHLAGQIRADQPRLAAWPRPDYPHTEADHLAVTNFLLEAITSLVESGGVVSATAAAQLMAPLLSQKAALELELGLTPVPPVAPEPLLAPPPSEVTTPVVASPAPEISVPPVIAPAVTSPAPSPQPEPKPPAAPLQDRLWRVFLSERTLQALLFLGIFLLFAAAVSFVLLGWRNFSAPMRVAIPAGFTLLFFALGRYIRFKSNMYRSGVALSAIAAMLVPIDFYTIYANFNIPPDWGPLFWLITSIACLAAYVLGTFMIRSRFFGYLVAAAAGSLILALIELAHQHAGLSLDWRSTGLMGLAMGLIALAALFERSWPDGRENWRFFFAEPFRYLAPLTAAVLLPLTFGWRYIDRPALDTLHYAMTANWWLGGLIFGWGAVHYRSRGLGVLAALALPVSVYFAQTAVFNQLDVNPAWHAFGLAWLVPLYLVTGKKLLTHRADPILYSHGRTAIGWGVALLLAAALWPLTDLASGAAASASHVVLAGALLLATGLWQRPRYLYGVSFFLLTSLTFALNAFGLNFGQVTPGWAALAVLHLLIALRWGKKWPAFAPPLVIAGFTLAAMAPLPALFPYHGRLLAYGLGNWLGMSAWGAWLAHTSQPGFGSEKKQAKSLFHWFTAGPLPVWLGLVFANARPLDFAFPLALAALAWGMAALSYRLPGDYRRPWHLTGLAVSVAAIFIAFALDDAGLGQPLTLLLAGWLYLFDAFAMRRAAMHLPGGLVTAWGFALLLNRLKVAPDAIIFALAGLIGGYFLIGLWFERRRSVVFTAAFFAPLYFTAHLLTMLVLAAIYLQPLRAFFTDFVWTDAMKAWGSASQILLGAGYGLFAWARYQERWAYVAAWLGAAGVGFFALAFSRGEGSAAAKGALGVVAFVLAERALHRLRHQPGLKRRWRAIARLAWPLYRRPLLVTGWIASVVIIGLALVRNLWLLGGGPMQRFWAWLGLLIIVSLYALSARLFRQVRFVWFAAVLVIAPWTILTSLGWYTPYRPTPPGYALSWVALAWALFLLHLLVRRQVNPAYARPLNAVAQVMLPLALLWAVADRPTSRFTVGLAIGLYALAAILAHRRYKGLAAPFRRTVFLYPALGLVPVWTVYLLAGLAPSARHEHYGLMLLIFGPLGLVCGQWLRRFGGTLADRYALPAYLTGYAALIVSTLLVAHLPGLLALVLLFDVLILLASARLFHNPLWSYPAGVLTPVALLIALSERGVPVERQGWWLIGLAAIYLALTWRLRRAGQPAYGTVTLTLGLALIALGLPPSSRDQVGALWGYGGAAVLYALTAYGLRQPLLLTPACALIVVPYAMGLQLSPLLPEDYGLALFPGAIIALGAARLLEVRLGAWRDFPWFQPIRWGSASVDRLLDWWALPVYALGFGLATMAPFFSDGMTGRAALNFALLSLIFGWAVYQFRLRGWLLAAGLAFQLAAQNWLAANFWWHGGAQDWLNFMPVTVLTLLAAMVVQWRRHEGSPFEKNRFWSGWSRPLYLLAGADMLLGQVHALNLSTTGATITLIHAVLLAALASFWASRRWPYLAIGLGTLSLGQWLLSEQVPPESVPVWLAFLTLGYGLSGCGLTLARRYLPDNRPLPAGLAVWEWPLRQSGLIISLASLLLAALVGIDLAGWTMRAMFGYSFREMVRPAVALMAVRVLGLVGLLYLAESLVRQKIRLGYVAVGMLLASWLGYAFYIQQWDGSARVQWYAIPVGLYLLGVAWLEWAQGNRNLARWIDYAATLLMLGSLFWQTLLFGWAYFLLLMIEGFASVFYGSARRLRRFLYSGMVGVILAVVSQLLNSLRSINQWLAFGLIGLLLIVGAIIVERKLDELKSLQGILETWE